MIGIQPHSILTIRYTIYMEKYVKLSINLVYHLLNIFLHTECCAINKKEL